MVHGLGHQLSSVDCRGQFLSPQFRHLCGPYRQGCAAGTNPDHPNKASLSRETNELCGFSYGISYRRKVTRLKMVQMVLFQWPYGIVTFLRRENP